MSPASDVYGNGLVCMYAALLGGCCPEEFTDISTRSAWVKTAIAELRYVELEARFNNTELQKLPLLADILDGAVHLVFSKRWTCDQVLQALEVCDIQLSISLLISHFL